MGNAWRVFARDIKRLITTPAAWAVILFLTVLPSLYTWFNVAGFWDPYNNTGNLRVCIVNEDEGADVEGVGRLALGDQIVEQLRDNDQLGWTFVDRAQAEEQVSSGAAYAAFVMPAGFSADVASILSGNFHQPEIEYYVNEKVGPVAPKITDAGASALDATINEAFVSTVSETIVGIADTTLAEIDEAGESARSSALGKVKAARDNIAQTRAKLDAAAGAARAAQGKIATTSPLLQEAKAQLEGLSNTLELVSLLAGNANSSLVRFSTTASGTLDDASHELSQSAARTNASVSEDANAVLAAKGQVDAAIANGKQLTDDITRLIDSLPSGVDASDLKRANDIAARNLEGLELVSKDAGEAATSIREATNAVNDATQQTLASSDGFRDTLNESIIPAISETLSNIAGITASLSSQATGQQTVIDQALIALDELSATLTTSARTLSSTGDKLGAIEGELDTLATDIAALSSAQSLAELIGADDIDPASIADFMMSPTQLQTEELYPLNAYGSAMAPLFINLTLWIGVFMLMVIIRLEVDDEGIERLTIAQRFFGRLLLLAPLVCIQAAICCTGCLWIGVQSESVAAFYATAIIASLSYLAIQYTLSTTLQHVGKAVCIILVFVQIPGASGIYPIEMTPDFFQAVYPLFPFTYGINAIRETISGFYDGQWASCIGVLVAFMVAFLVIGTAARPYLTNLNRMFAREIAESDLIIGESVELPARRWRMSQIIRALSDREEYRTALEKRANRFMRLYPQVKAGSMVVGVMVPVVSAAVLIPLGADKVLILTTWLVWLVAIISFLLVIEFFRDSLSHQLSLEAMDVGDMRKLIGSRNRFTQVKPLEQDVVGDKESSRPGERGPR